MDNRTLPGYDQATTDSLEVFAVTSPLPSDPLPEATAGDQGPSPQDLARCLEVLQALRERPHLFASADAIYTDIRSQAGRLLHAAKAHEKAQRQRHDRDLLSQTGIRRRRQVRAEGEAADTLLEPPANLPPLAQELREPRRCYVCKKPYTQLHFFYDHLCPVCAEYNHARRQQSADLTGRVALVTGARIKIGFEIALKLLRAGADVLATTRFPRDAALRFARQPDFADWAHRLHLYGIDLRYLAAVERFTAHLVRTYDRLDVLINNAAQTLRRPPAFYQHLLAGEMQDLADLPEPVRRLLAGPRHADRALAGPEAGPPDERLPTDHFGPAPSALLSQVPLLPGDEQHDLHFFPPGLYDADRQQVDRRPENSWTHRLADVSTPELLEVHAVNCLAPFLLIRNLEPLLLRSPQPDRYIINVSAREGQFGCVFKTGRHPHTNMAKAALNMLTRTCAELYAGRGIHMNSVDTGWVSNEHPHPVAAQMAAEGFQPPLDEIDGAARVLDPIFVGVNTGQNVFGKHFKDYLEAAW